MWKLVVHSLKMRKVQTASIMLAVALSVMTLLALTLVYGGVQEGVRMQERRSGAQAIALPSSVVDSMDVSQLLFTGVALPEYVSAETAKHIAETEGIARSTALFYTQTLNESCCSATGGLKIIGVDFTTDWTIQPFCVYPLTKEIGAGNVIIGANVGGEIGENIQLLSNKYTVWAKLEPSGTDLDNSILMDIGEARKISAESQGLSYLWKKFGNPEGLVSAVLIDYKQGADTFRVNNRITAIGGVNVVERTSVIEDAQRSLQAVFIILLGAGVVMLVVTIVQMLSRFYTCVWDRKSELALYRAIGASVSDLRRMIGIEASVLTAGGFLLGVLAGFALFCGLIMLLQDASAFPFIALSSGAITLIICCLACLFAFIAAVAVLVPLRHIGRLDPSLAMQQGDID